VITGAGSGIGCATALRFLDEGASVIAGVYHEAEVHTLQREAGERASLRSIRCDVTQPDEVKALMDAAAAQFGGIDILVANAGIAESGDVTESTPVQWDRLLDVNLKGVLLAARFAVPHMLDRGGGSIVTVSSINGIRGNHRLVAYAASKGGVVAATMAMALDYAAQGIRVNCVCPATIADTPMVAKAFAEASDPERFRDYLLAKHPMGRFGRAAEVAAAIRFLASDEASFITGVVLPVDGGRSVR